ncbi:MAG: DUF3107 domain-containing protein [Acidimicrobiia bacterium]|nr:DUF3107 domain-containing protein [Acidimicrobiia bacterium]
MQVRIGVIYSPREIEVDVDNDADEVTSEVEKVLQDGAPILWLTDRRGRRVAIVADKITYVEVGSDSGERRVGFSAL